jgi:hypothetical protein
LKALLYNHKVNNACKSYICAVCPLGIANYDARTEYPRIAAWMERVRQDLNPHYDEAHSIINKMAMKPKL